MSWKTWIKSKQRSESAAHRLLRKFEIVEPPVDVARIARELGILVAYEEFEDDGLSGLLYREKARRFIGVNANHAETRQRFTIAHELGHLKLHEGLFVDPQTRINWRDKTKGHGNPEQEREANWFAAELLMPEKFLKKALQQRAEDGVTQANSLVRKLAKEFRVSVQAMEYRLVNLGYISKMY